MSRVDVSRRAVLLLAFQFPPGRGSGVYRTREWANRFAARGWDVTVLTVHPDFFSDVTEGRETGAREGVDPRVDVVEVKFPHEQLIRDVSRMSWLHATFPRPYARFWRWVPERFFPEPYGHLLPLLVTKGLALRARKRFDLVFATGNPFAQLGAAHVLAARLGIPYVVDFHDAWTLDQFGEKPAFPEGHGAYAWEQRIVDGAARTITVNQPLVDWFAGTYPERSAEIRLVENGFNETVLLDPGFRSAAGRPLRFGYVGTVRNDLPLDDFGAAWRTARSTEALRNSRMDYFGYLGFFAWNATPLKARIGVGADGVDYRGPVPQSGLTETYRDLDVLVMMTPSSRFVTAGKLYDYMASGRVILGVHDARNDSTTVAGDYPLFVASGSTDPTAIASALVRAGELAASVTESDHAAARAASLQHTWKLHMDPLLDEIEDEVVPRPEPREAQVTAT